MKGKKSPVENSLVINALEVPVGSTRDHSQSQKPVAEVDTHGVFNGKKLKQEAYNKINKYWIELQNGGWIGYTTGTYGDAVVGTPKFNAQLNSKIEAKVDGLRKEFAKEGYTFKQDPKNPGIHVVRKSGLSFLEDTPNKDYVRKSLNSKIKKALAPYKKNSPYKHSKISDAARKVLKSTQLDLANRGDALTLAQLTALDGIVSQTITEGKDFIKGVKQKQKEDAVEQKSESNKLVKESQEDAPNYKDRDKLLNKLKRTKFSSLLAPASNNDFEGLLYRLLPKGKARLAAKKLIDSVLLDPLAKANAEHLNWKNTLRNLWTANSNKLKESGHKITDESGITLNNEEGSYNLTKGEVVKAYNYAKDPNTYGQLERGGFDLDKINEIVDYIHSEPALREYANGISETYAAVAPAINNKLNEHGRSTFTSPRIDVDALTPQEKEVLTKVYGSPIPTFATYTPVTATGADLDTDIDNLLKDGNYNMYSVMDGRLKNRTGGGKINIAGTNTESDFESYLRGPVRTLAFMDFAKNASNFFGKEQIEAMKLKYGDTWVDAMKDSLRRIVTGRNTPTNKTKASNFIERTLQRQVGGVMFFNVRSALLQHLSYFNYMFDDLTAVRRGQAVSKEVKEKIAEKMKPYLEDRGRGKTELLVDQIFGRGTRNPLDYAIEKGYSLTKWGDKNAISFGGGQFMAGKYSQYIEQGLSEKEALDKAYTDFIRVTEASQQSTNPERLGKEQTTTIGRYILAFANTPQQYNRKISRAIQDLKGLKGDSSPEANKRKKQAIGEVVWYLGAQNAIFTSLQQLAFAGVGLDAGDDEEKRAANWLNSMVNTVLRGAGIYGALVATAKDAIIAVSRDKDVSESIVNTMPSVGNLVRNVKTAAGQKPSYAKSQLTDDLNSKELYQVAAGLTAAGVPANKALKVVEQVADVVASDLGVIERLARAAGYERYQIDENLGGPLKRLSNGEAGQAHSDGTIEVDPNLSKEEKRKTIQHEKKHVRDMEDGDLSYTDNSLTYNGKTYERKGGKINYNGKWIKEGSKEFPWEKVAYNAESPLNQNGDKTIEQHDEEADAFTTEHFNDPNTRKRLKEQTGLSDEDIDKRISEATGTHVEQNAFLEAGDAEYNAPGRFFGEVIPEGEEGHSPGNIQVGVDLNQESNQGVLEHEQAHALGFDDTLGLRAQEILGEAKHDSYLNQPGETYGNIQEFRKIVGIKPWERNLTPERIMELIEFQGVGDQEDVQQLLNNYDIEKLSEALNTVASTDTTRERAKV